MAMGQEEWGNGDDQLNDCNGATSIAIAMALGQGHWGRSNMSNRSKSNCNGEWAINGDGDVYVLFQGPMSCIVVDKIVQNVWAANIRDFVPANRTYMF
jgi:hypothetical protein